MKKIENPKYKLTWDSTRGLNDEQAYEAINTLADTIDDLIDLANSQQEAIEELQTEIGVLRDEVFRSPEPADDKPEPTPDKYWGEELPTDTHRTVTLRIPRGMRIGEAITSIPRGVGTSDFYLWLCEAPDTDLQKALDEVKE